MDTSTIIYIVLAAFVVFTLYKQFAPIKGLKTLSSADFQKEIQEKSTDKLVVDVREPQEYQTGYIPGAKNVPLSQLSQRLDQLPKENQLYLYCRSGSRSKQAARILSKNGYTSLAHLQGGIASWRGKVTK
ncbi:MAG: sulfurtransferase [Paenibacillus sp. RIFOXYA1_FULL_44_5]|nr:MAG: sulfurtransferase [Paenibacillus sp. RIFOXYA1_FULL_44_5]